MTIRRKKKRCGEGFRYECRKCRKRYLHESLRPYECPFCPGTLLNLLFDVDVTPR